ncbi:MAG TPA: SDR family NAD(P)-dependent oxidoreductase, partial [Phnomibacter sp.]|nr:SDR family NAD(P)-dependent oxidoreductase [Phnomibacter sp.]
AVAQLPEWVEQVDVLVNNAGGAIGRDPFDVADLDDWDTMLDTNVKGLLYITKALLPRIKQSKEPHIINIGSIAGKEVYENGNLYCAAKHAVHAISQSMRIDLLKYGIKVTLVAPGAVETEFSLVRFKGDAQKAAAVYQGYQPLTAEDVANVVGFAANQPPHVCLNEIVLTPTAQANSFYLHR